MRITLNLERNSKPNRIGRHSIMLRLPAKGQKPARVLTGVEITNPAKTWNLVETWEKCIKPAYPEHKELNKKLFAICTEAQTRTEEWLKVSPLPPEQAKARLENASGPGVVFAGLAERVIGRSRGRVANTLHSKRMSSLLRVMGWFTAQHGAEYKETERGTYVISFRGIRARLGSSGRIPSLQVGECQRGRVSQKA